MTDQARKIILIVLGLFIALFVIGLIISLLGGGGKTITITSEDGAQIFVAEEEDTEYTLIGTTSASYDGEPGDFLYFMAEKDGKRSRYSAIIQENDEINLPLNATVTANELFPGNVNDPLLVGRSAYGIDPQTSSFVGFNLDSFVPTESKYLDLPYLRNIFWGSENNFLYESATGQVGAFRNVDLGVSGVGVNVTDSTAQNSANLVDTVFVGDGTELIFTSASKYPNKPVALLSSTGIFTSTDFGRSVKRIFSSPDIDNLSRVYSDNEFIYLTDTLPPAEYATEVQQNQDTTDENTIENIKPTTVTVLSYTGEVVRSFQTNSTNVDDIFTVNDTTYVLDGSGLQRNTNESDTQQIPFFESVETAVGVNGSVVYVDSTGVWGVGESSIKYLLYGFAEGESGVNSSLTIIDNSLVFGATGKKAGSNSLGQTYSIPLSQLQ